MLLSKVLYMRYLNFFFRGWLLCRAKLAIVKADQHSDFNQFLLVVLQTCGTNSGTTSSSESKSDGPSTHRI